MLFRHAAYYNLYNGKKLLNNQQHVTGAWFWLRGKAYLKYSSPYLEKNKDKRDQNGVVLCFVL